MLIFVVIIIVIVINTTHHLCLYIQCLCLYRIPKISILVPYCMFKYMFFPPTCQVGCVTGPEVTTSLSTSWAS